MALIRQAALNVPWKLEFFQGAAYHSERGAPPAVLSTWNMQVSLGPPGQQIKICFPRVALLSSRRTFAYKHSSYVWRPYNFSGRYVRACPTICCLSNSDRPLCSASMILTREDPKAPSIPRLKREQVAVYHLRAVRTLDLHQLCALACRLSLAHCLQDGNNDLLLHPTSQEHLSIEWAQLVAITALGMQYAN